MSSFKNKYINRNSGETNVKDLGESKKGEQRFKMRTTGRFCHRMTHMRKNANSVNAGFTFPHFAFFGTVYMLHTVSAKCPKEPCFCGPHIKVTLVCYCIYSKTCLKRNAIIPVFFSSFHRFPFDKGLCFNM
jgi:hypothetical protein